MVVRFLLKAFIMAALFFIGVFVGIQEANTGMKKMRGYDDPSLSSAFSIEEKSDGQYEMTVLGKTKTHDLEEKKERLEQMKTFNLLTEIAKNFSGWLTDLFGKIVPD